eukprot:scaffold58867_cov19-Tisochrysis_lutea.AAC.2
MNGRLLSRLLTDAAAHHCISLPSILDCAALFAWVILSYEAGNAEGACVPAAATHALGGANGMHTC